MRILLVEDSERLRRSVGAALKKSGYLVDAAGEGQEGLWLAESNKYDVIVLDIMLPGLDGLSLLHKLRQEGKTTHVLLLTAKDTVEDRVRGLRQGADDYLVKPFAFTELLARIKALSRRPKDSLGSVLSLSDLSLNTLTYDVTRSGVPLHLSRKEYALLEYLLRHSNTIVTKEQIINNTWDYDADILPNTVEVYIGYLRNKVDKPFPKSPRLIHTVRGFGYKIGLDK